MARSLPIDRPDIAAPAVLDDDGAELQAILETVRNEETPERLLHAARTLQLALDAQAQRRRPS